MKISVLITMLCASFTLTKGQQAVIPDGGTIVSQVGINKDFVVQGQEYGDISIGDVKGQSFKKALIATTLFQPRFPNEFQIQIPNEKPVERGDLLLLTFFAKTDVSAQVTGDGTITCTFEQTSPPYDKSLVYETRINGSWNQYYIPFIAPNEFKTKEAQVILQLGYPQQIMQIADIKLINYQQKLPIKALPVNKVSYSGRELDASWRKAAQERIEKHRKGDIEIQVVDKKGHPIKDARVELTLHKHLFGFGTHIDASAIASNKTYQEKVLTLFNEVSLEKDLGKQQWQDDFQRQKTAAVMDLFEKNHIPVNGHSLLWPSSGFYPEWLQNLHGKSVVVKEEVSNQLSDAEFNLLHNDIIEKTSNFRNKLNGWELVNDLYDNPDRKTLLEKNALTSWSKMVKTEAPKTGLYIANYGVLDNGGTDEERQQYTYHTLKSMIETGAPIDGISLACHFKHNPTAPQVLIKVLDYYASLGKTIRITEFDMANRDELLQADYTRDFYTAVFSHPAVSGISLWGFWEGQHRRPSAAMYRQDWSVKPNGKAWEDLVFNQWVTKANGKTDNQGKYNVRGFLGEYTYEVKANGNTIKGNVKAVSNSNSNTFIIEVQ